MGRALKLAGEPLLAVVLGPTASGKTALALALAERFGGEIVNCDSVAMYREFEIGTAKPTAAERARAPHHLFDIVDPTAYVTAGEYVRRARTLLPTIGERGRPCCRGSFPARSGRKSCASVYGNGRSRGERDTCTRYFDGSIRRQRHKFMPTMGPS
jgi:hypothetical protein